MLPDSIAAVLGETVESWPDRSEHGEPRKRPIRKDAKFGVQLRVPIPHCAEESSRSAPQVAVAAVAVCNAPFV
jgi:hypothetical protein